MIFPGKNASPQKESRGTLKNLWLHLSMPMATACPVKLMAIVLALIISAGCSDRGVIENEVVLCAGDYITAKNNKISIKISAVDGEIRKYKTVRYEVAKKLERRSERWNGSLGLYSPGGKESQHMVLEEGQQFFSSEKEALFWLSLIPGGRENINIVYSSDGLVIVWDESDKHFSVELWQLYIDRKKPVGLMGSKEQNIRIIRSGENKENCNIKGDFLASKPSIIDGRKYSGKSIDMIEEKNVNISFIEKIIDDANLVKNKQKYSMYLNPDYSFPFVVLVSSSGEVVALR